MEDAQKDCKVLGVKVDPSYRIKVPQKRIEILTVDEVLRIISACTSHKARTLVSVLYEGGFRPGELLSLHDNNVFFDDRGCLVTVQGKTGVRTVRLVRSSEALQLYIRTSPPGRLFPMTTEALNKMVKRAAKRAGVTKLVRSKLFRHTRNTHLTPYMTEAERRIYFGWSKNSTMPNHYCHLADNDVNEKVVNIAVNMPEIQPIKVSTRG